MVVEGLGLGGGLALIERECLYMDAPVLDEKAL
jgi:hypothetical protein